MAGLSGGKSLLILIKRGNQFPPEKGEGIKKMKPGNFPAKFKYLKNGDEDFWGLKVIQKLYPKFIKLFSKFQKIQNRQ
jgi:hypothetical protein